ncbi:MAG: hypothetical protein ACPGXY_05745, partial [Alphaproteobacteria bacterium]
AGVRFLLRKIHLYQETLKKLILTDLNKPLIDAVIDKARCLSNLEEFQLLRCVRGNGKLSILELKKLPELVESCPLKKLVLKKYAGFPRGYDYSHLSGIEHLSVYWAYTEEDDLMKLTSLKVLDISNQGLRNLSQKFVQSVGLHPTLKKLNISGNTCDYVNTLLHNQFYKTMNLTDLDVSRMRSTSSQYYRSSADLIPYLKSNNTSLTRLILDGAGRGYSNKEYEEILKLWRYWRSVRYLGLRNMGNITYNYPRMRGTNDFRALYTKVLTKYLSTLDLVSESTQRIYDESEKFFHDTLRYGHRVYSSIEIVFGLKDIRYIAGRKKWQVTNNDVFYPPSQGRKWYSYAPAKLHVIHMGDNYKQFWEDIGNPNTAGCDNPRMKQIQSIQKRG